MDPKNWKFLDSYKKLHYHSLINNNTKQCQLAAKFPKFVFKAMVGLAGWLSFCRFAAISVFFWEDATVWLCLIASPNFNLRSAFEVIMVLNCSGYIGPIFTSLFKQSSCIACVVFDTLAYLFSSTRNETKTGSNNESRVNPTKKKIKKYFNHLHVNSAVKILFFYLWTYSVYLHFFDNWTPHPLHFDS